MMGVEGSQSRTPAAPGSSDSNAGGDDPLDTLQPYRSRSREQMRDGGSASPYGYSGSAHGGGGEARGMVQPIIKVRPEYGTIYRKDPTGARGKQNVVCVFSVEIPSRRPPPSLGEQEEQQRQLARNWSAVGGSALGSIADADDASDTRSVSAVSRFNGGSTVDSHHMAPSEAGDEQDVRDGHRPVTPDNGQRRGEAPRSPDADEEGFSFGATPAAGSIAHEDPFKPVMDDLRNRIADWKGHSIERFGQLVLYDYLGVRQDEVVREFFVYLFHEALLCVAEERKKEKGLSRFMTGPTERSAGAATDSIRQPGAAPGSGPRPALKLKGRIWLRHIRRVQDTSSNGNLSLSVKLDDESLNHFILCFKDRGTLETWRGKLVELVQVHKPQEPPSTPVSDASRSAFSQPDATPTSPAVTSATSRRGTATSTISAMSGKTSGTSPTSRMQKSPAMAQHRSTESLHLMNRSSSQPLAHAPHQQWSASGGLDPGLPPPELLPHTPMDLVIIVSVPAVPPTQQHGSSVSSSAALKLRLIRSTLEFVVSHLGPKDRLAIVAYSVGTEGEVRRSALLNTNKEKSRARLELLIEGIGQPWSGDGEDPFRESLERLGGSTDRTDTITAVNVGLDIVLQRKSRNPVTGILLINDTADAPRRGQMDLVMARAEAANVPIHSFGFGKSHDPSSLWLISNHTRGSYT
jgi:hypothetical protein